MINTKEKQVVEKVEVSIQCDRCHREINYSDPEYQSIFRLDLVAGFASPFGDGNRVQCELCSECIHSVIGPYCRVQAE